MKKRSFHGFRDEFEKYKEENVNIKLIYEDEKRRYEGEENLNISLEKTYLKAKLQQYENNGFTNSKIIILVMFIGAITLLFNILISSRIVIAVMEAASIIIIVLYLYLRDKYRKIVKDNYRLYLEICLIVLTDIAKDRHIQKQSSKLLNQNNLED